MSVAGAEQGRGAVIPPRIRRGAKLGISAPSGPVDAARLARGVALLAEVFDVVVAPGVLAPRTAAVPSFLSASDESRAAELEALIADPDVRAIVVARGGYGISRLLPLLDPAKLRADPKPIVGFSDATALLVWAHRAGVRGVHGPVAQQLGDLPAMDVEQLIRVLTEPVALGPRPWPLTAYGTGRHRGPLLGGNVSVLATLAGTPWTPVLRGAIALLEEVGERPYEIDRCVTQLIQAGVLAGAAGALVGDLTRCVDPRPPAGGRDPSDAARVALLERLHAAEVAAATGAPIGHGDRNESVPFGAMCELDLDRGTLAILEPAVA